MRATNRGEGGAIILAAVGLACASAFGFSFSTSLQHRAAGKVPAAVTRGFHLIGYLAHKPLWVLGIVLGAVSFSLHAAALNLGSIAFVQPIMAAGMIFAVPVRAWMDSGRPSQGELRAVSIAIAGLLVFLTVTDADPAVSTVDWGYVVGFDALALGLVLLLSKVAPRFRDSRHQAIALGSGAGVLFGVVAGMLKVLIETFETEGVLNVGVGLTLLFLAACGLIGMILNQRAYRVAPLSMSMPVLNIVNVLVAMLFSWWLLGAAPSSSWLVVGVQAVGLVIMFVGVKEIARAHEAAGGGPDALEPDVRRPTQPGPVG